MSEDFSAETLVTLTADIVSAHVSNNSVAVSDVPSLIASIHGALAGLGTPAPVVEEKKEPAVSIRASVKPDHLVCLDCGKTFKMLKRHLMTDHQTTPAGYRAKWNLPANYPMAAPAYAAMRKDLALKIGLGRKAGQSVVKKAAPAKTAKQPRAKAITAAKAHLGAK